MDINKLTDQQLSQLVNNRWASSDTVWDIVKKAYAKNLAIYKNEPEWVNANTMGRNRAKIRANRIFRDTESVINALIANPPQPNIIPTRDTITAKTLARLQEKYFLKKYTDLNVKEQFRKGLRNLYFARLIVLKPFWNPKINDFDVRSIDPNKIRVSKHSTKESDSEFVIEEVTDNLSSVLGRFPAKKTEILKMSGFQTEEQAFIENPEFVYKEAWVNDMLIASCNAVILSRGRNPYWDWDGLLLTPDEEAQLSGPNAVEGDARRNIMKAARGQQDQRIASIKARMTPQDPAAAAPEQDPAATPAYKKGEQPIPSQPEGATNVESYNAYYFNHFDEPRKPYIFATMLNNENTPIGQTDFITQAAPLQEGIDRRKQDIDENASLVNGQIKVDSSVMSKADAQKLRYEARGVIYGKGVASGVTRETGTALPEFVYKDMQDSRAEIDNIMGASAAFRGEREGQETKAGRLALIDQSYLALNEMVQVVDYVSLELFNWFYQLAKVRYTEYHYAKTLGKDNAIEIMQLMQDDFEDGTEVKVIAGKTLPEDRQFKWEQAQNDVKDGILSPVDYFEVAGYDDPSQKAKNAVVYKLNPSFAVGLKPEELAQIAPPATPDMPSRSISFKDLPPDGQIQMAKQAGIQLDPVGVIAGHINDVIDKKKKAGAEAAAAEQPVKSPIQV